MPLRHRAGARPAVGPDAAAHRLIIGWRALLFALARWHRAGRTLSMPLFQFQLMGLYGAFLTGRPVQPVRVLRGAAGGLLRLLLHGSGRGAGARGCTTSRSTCWPRRCS
ncbi:MAG: hypothetical protein LKM38_01855 [Pseudomonas veronii]|nr:hypothetical protein [Pseudomonas veronii]